MSLIMILIIEVINFKKSLYIINIFLNIQEAANIDKMEIET